MCVQFANLFETNSASEWLLYISEWPQPHGGPELSNIRVTTKVAVNALLGDTPQLQDFGSAIMHNLGTKEVKAVVCIRSNVILSLCEDNHVEMIKRCLMYQITLHSCRTRTKLDLFLPQSG